MKHLSVFCLLIIACCSCEKNVADEFFYPPSQSITDTINVIELTTYNPSFQFDTIGNNYIKEFLFSKIVQAGDTQAVQIKGFAASNNATFKIRYMGEWPLFTINNLLSRNDTAAFYNITNGLMGRKLFEVYDAGDTMVTNKFIASEDSVKIILHFSTDSMTTNTLIINAFQYYLRPNNISQLTYDIMK